MVIKTIKWLQIYPHCLNTIKGTSKASTVDIFKAENPKRHHNCFIKPYSEQPQPFYKHVHVKWSPPPPPPSEKNLLHFGLSRSSGYLMFDSNECELSIQLTNIILLIYFEIYWLNAIAFVIIVVSTTNKPIRVQNTIMKLDPINLQIHYKNVACLFLANN